MASLLKKLIFPLLLFLIFPQSVSAATGFSNPSPPWGTQLENSTFSFTATVDNPVNGRVYKVGYSHPNDSASTPAHALWPYFPNQSGGTVSINQSIGPLSPAGTYYLFIYYISNGTFVLASSPLVVGAAPTAIPTNTPIPTSTPPPGACVANIALQGGWDDWGMGAQTGTSTLKVTNFVSNAVYEWKIGGSGWLRSNVDNKTISYPFSSPGDYTISAVQYTFDNVTFIPCTTTSNTSLGGSAVVHVYNVCTGGGFSNGANITSTNGSIVNTCITPNGGGCVGGSSYQVGNSGLGEWGYFGAGAGIMGSASMRNINGGGVATPDFAAFLPPSGTLNQSYGFGSTCFRVQSSANQSATLNIGGGVIYCRPAAGGSCAGGGSPGGPGLPHIKDVAVDLPSCSYRLFGADNYYVCKVNATAQFGTPGNYRFGNFKWIDPPVLQRVATEPCLDDSNGGKGDGCRYTPWNGGACSAGVTPIGDDFTAVKSVAFTPSESGTLDRIKLRIRREGAGLTFVNVKITDSDWCWDDSCVIPPALTGLGGQPAEAGGTINQNYTFGTGWDQWLVVSFAGSQPVLETGHQYRIYIESSFGQDGTKLDGAGSGWYSRKENSGVCSGKRYGYEVWILKNKEIAGDFFVSSPPGDNPLSGLCTSISPCPVWWRPEGSGTYTISADLLINGLASKVGKRATTATYGPFTIAVPSPTPTPTPEVLPWFQVQGGDVHAVGNITSLISATAVNKAFNLDDLNGYPGVVSFTGSVNFNSAKVSSTNWLANSSNLNTFSYTSYYQKFSLPIPANFFGNLSDITQNGIYFAGVSTPVTINNNWSFPNNRKAIIFIDGDLTINNNISVPVGSFLAFIVKNNIIIKGSLGDKQNQVLTGITAHLQGVYLADGIIDTYSNSNPGLGSGFRLVAAGIFYANGGFHLGRNLKDSGNPNLGNDVAPAELFISRPDLIINAPSTLFSSSFSWQEVAP